METSFTNRRRSITLTPPTRQPQQAAVSTYVVPYNDARPNVLKYIDAFAYPLLLQICFVGMVFGNSIDVSKEIQQAGQSSLTFQILFKLCFTAMGCGLGFWGVWFRRDIRRLMLTFPGILLGALAVWHLVTIPMSLMPSKAFISFVSFVSVLLVSVAMLIEFGIKRTVLASIIGIELHLVVSVVLYIVAPELATFKEVLNDVVTVERFGGLSHPNYEGRYAVLGSLLAIAAVSEGWLNWKWLIPIGVLSLGVLVACLSRTPLVAGMVAMAVISVPLLRSGQTFLAIALAAMAIMLGYLAFETKYGSDAIVRMIVAKTTKTGSSEEITTGTGRTEIWQYSISKSMERPLFGWGMGSTSLVMEEHAGHSHNILLHPILALGFPGGALVLAILILDVIAAFNSNSILMRSVITFIIVLGLVESPLLGSFSEGLCMLWFILTLIPIVTIWQQGSWVPNAEKSVANAT